jgi:hypothetical protein
MTKDKIDQATEVRLQAVGRSLGLAQISVANAFSQRIGLSKRQCGNSTSRPSRSCRRCPPTDFGPGFWPTSTGRTCCITTDCRCDDVVGGQLRASISAHVVLAVVNIAPLFYVLCAFTSYCTSLVGCPVHAGV